MNNSKNKLLEILKLPPFLYKEIDLGMGKLSKQLKEGDRVWAGEDITRMSSDGILQTSLQVIYIDDMITQIGVGTPFDVEQGRHAIFFDFSIKKWRSVTRSSTYSKLYKLIIL